MLQKQVELWMERYDADVEAKQKELDVLKASKAKDLEKLQNLTKLVSIYIIYIIILLYTYCCNISLI